MVRWAWLDWGMSEWLTNLLQCFNTVGWVIRPVKTVGLYNLYCVGADVKPCSIDLHWIIKRCGLLIEGKVRLETVFFLRLERYPSHLPLRTLYMKYLMKYLKNPCHWLYICSWDCSLSYQLVGLLCGGSSYENKASKVNAQVSRWRSKNQKQVALVFVWDWRKKLLISDWLPLICEPVKALKLPIKTILRFKI